MLTYYISFDAEFYFGPLLGPPLLGPLLILRFTSDPCHYTTRIVLVLYSLGSKIERNPFKGSFYQEFVLCTTDGFLHE